MVELYIFLFLLGTTVLNLAIAFTARIKSKNQEFNQLIYYWISTLLSYVAVAVLSDGPVEIAFSSFFIVAPVFMLAKMLLGSRGKPFRWRLYSSIFVAGALVSTYLLLYTDLGFTYSLLPVNLCTSLALWEPSLLVLIFERRASNWIEKAMGFVLLLGWAHHLNFAFFRLDPQNAWWGWSVSLAIYQCLSIFLVLLINHKRESRERENLVTALTRISGLSMHQEQGLDDLHRKLQLQISLKEELTLELQKANVQLREEREMNEMLIKTISHDLANPLTVVNAYADLLHTGKIDENEKGIVWDRLKISTRTALDMIYRIRNAIVTRNQANFIHLASVSIDEAINETIHMFDSRLKEKKLTVTYRNLESEPLFVEAEEKSLVDHVLCNLMSNAVKYSYEGGEIQLTTRSMEETIEVEFKDFGCGISPNRMTKNLLHTTRGTQGEQGSGFGLMIMGYFVRKFGGSYEILPRTTESSKGTSIVLRLKRSPTASAKVDAPTASPILNPGSSEIYKVLTPNGQVQS